MKKVTLFILLFSACSLYLHAADTLQQYVAKYKFPPGTVVEEVNVILENGVLSLTSAMGNASLEKTATDTFNIAAYNGTAIFVRNDTKKITGIKIDVMGMNLEGTRDEKTNFGSGTMPPLPVNKTPFPMKYMPSMLVEEDLGQPNASPSDF